MNAIGNHLLQSSRLLGLCFAGVGAAGSTLLPLDLFQPEWGLPATCLAGIAILVATETPRFGFGVAVKRISGILALGALVSLGLMGIAWGIAKDSWWLAGLAVLALLATPWLMHRLWGSHLDWKGVPGHVPSNTSPERTRES